MCKMKQILILLSVVVIAVACGNRRPSVAELQQKIDSVRALEVERQLRLKGIQLRETTPFQMFYDSLQLQALPLNYSEEYVTYLPNFMPVPIAIFSYLELEGREAPKAIALPETLSSRLMLLAADTEDSEYELWLYSLDNDCIPVDKLLVYEPSKFNERKFEADQRETYFSINSHLEINIMEYADDDDQTGQLSTYVVDNSRQFVEKLH